MFFITFGLANLGHESWPVRELAEHFCNSPLALNALYTIDDSPEARARARRCIAKIKNKLEVELYFTDNYYTWWMQHGNNRAISDHRFIYDLLTSRKRKNLFMKAWGGNTHYSFLIDGVIIPMDYESLQAFRLIEIRKRK